VETEFHDFLKLASMKSMQFIVNTAVDPHFCALFDSDNTLIEQKKWDQRNTDGQQIYDFLKKHDIANINLNLIGGLTGPGGFSSLRIASTVLNSLSFAKKIDIHSIRVDHWLRDWIGHSDFILNSFGKSVWEAKGAELSRIDIDEAVAQYGENPMYVDLLPVEKKSLFKEQIKPEGSLVESLFQALKKQSPQPQFLPDYEVPPVN